MVLSNIEAPESTLLMLWGFVAQQSAAIPPEQTKPMPSTTSASATEERNTVTKRRSTLESAAAMVLMALALAQRTVICASKDVVMPPAIEAKAVYTAVTVELRGEDTLVANSRAYTHSPIAATTKMPDERMLRNRPASVARCIANMVRLALAKPVKLPTRQDQKMSPDTTRHAR